MAAFYKTSFIRARDPSIPSKSTFKIKPQAIFDKMSMLNNSDESELAVPLEEEEEEETGKLEVFLRVKHIENDDNLYHINDNTLICSVPDDSQAGRNIKGGEQLNRIYTFTKIFPPHSQQTEVFDSVVRRKVLKCINGQNTNLLTYGPSGSGKTFTIVGTKEHPGMLPQSLEYLFRSVPQLSVFPVVKPVIGKRRLCWLTREESEYEVNEMARIFVHHSDDMNMHRARYSEMQKRLSKEPVALLDIAHGTSLGVWITFAEIYNESVYDLLQITAGSKRPRQTLKIFNNNGETYIKDLKQIYVTNGHEAYCVLQQGLLNLRFAATSLNAHSSRSHCIFTISLVQTSGSRSGDFVISRLNFCDLAGSERTKKTNNVGCRLNESNNINNSLLVLGRCISAIRKAQKTCGKQVVIPFRESKLTQLFHKALQGDEDISMIVAINPDRSMFDETIHALNFSAIAKEITLDKVDSSYASQGQARLQTHFSVKEYEAKIAELHEQVENLTAEMQEQLEKYDLRETQVRKDLIERFKQMAAEKQDVHDEEMDRALEEKDEIIEALRAELTAIQGFSDADSSVISISSGDTSLVEKMTDLHTANKRYHQLSKEYAKFRNDAQIEKLELLAQIEELTRENKHQGELLRAQKLDIIKLTDENQCLEADVHHSIRYTNVLVQQFEDNSPDEYDSQSDEHTDHSIQ